MKRLTVFIALFFIGAGLSHWLFLNAFPAIVLDIAYEKLEGQIGDTNVFVERAAVTPETQTIVRTSPDLSYGACLVDLSDGPVRVTGARSRVYGSLSVYNHETDVIFATSLRASDAKPNAVILALEGQTVSETELPVVRTSGAQAVAVIRRLGTKDDILQGETSSCDQISQ